MLDSYTHVQVFYSTWTDYKLYGFGRANCQTKQFGYHWHTSSKIFNLIYSVCIHMFHLQLHSYPLRCIYFLFGHTQYLYRLSTSPTLTPFPWAVPYCIWACLIAYSVLKKVHPVISEKKDKLRTHTWPIHQTKVSIFPQVIRTQPLAMSHHKHSLRSRRIKHHLRSRRCVCIRCCWEHVWCWWGHWLLALCRWNGCWREYDSRGHLAGWCKLMGNNKTSKALCDASG
jgi:hypothetical protein